MSEISRELQKSIGLFCGRLRQKGKNAQPMTRVFEGIATITVDTPDYTVYYHLRIVPTEWRGKQVSFPQTGMMFLSEDMRQEYQPPESDGIIPEWAHCLVTQTAQPVF